ncbi:hypothetical protein ACWF94_35430 [Streptomyces sp. NPDC055078]
MPESMPAHREPDARTCRSEDVEDHAESLQVQTGGNFTAVIEGQAALHREVRDGFAAVNTRLDSLTNEVRSSNAQITGLLTRLVTQGVAADNRPLRPPPVQ